MTTFGNKIVHSALWQTIFQYLIFIFSSYLDNILEELAPNDVRTLIKAEEELSQTNHFTRIFPSPTSHKYFQYFYEGIPYYDKLLDAWEFKYHDQRSKAIRRLKMLCAKAVHL